MSEANISERACQPISSGPVLIALASIRNTEAQLRWQGAQWVVALNLTAFVALTLRLFVQIEAYEFFWLAAGCATAAALDYEWYNVLRRDGRLLDFWNKKIQEHERRCGIEGALLVFTSDAYQKLSASRDRLQRTLERLTVFFLLVWCLAAIVGITWGIALLKGVTT